MERRTFLTAAASATAVGLAGCGQNDTEGEESPGGSPTEDDDGETPASDPGTTDGTTETLVPAEGDPATVARDYITALGNGDEDGAMALIHADSQLVQNGQLTNRDYVETMAAANITVLGTEVVRNDQTRAAVNVTIRAEMGENSGEDPRGVKLRSDGGEWRVWDDTEPQ